MVQIHRPTEIGILVAGLVLIVLSALQSAFWSRIIIDIFNRDLPIRPGSRSFHQWRKTPVPLYMKVYFWNWTNARDVYQAGFVPSFVEVGPYVFKEIHEKVNLTWNINNGTITYRTIKRWFFEPGMSNGSLSDNVTSVNVVAATVSHMAAGSNRFLLYALSIALRSTGQEIWWTRNVSELLFDGFENSIQSLGAYFSMSETPEKFGFFYEKNGTLPDDVFNMCTGTVDVSEIGALKYWNYKNKTDYYAGCEDVVGSTGEFWPPDNTKDRPLLMYSADMCRQVRFYYEEDAIFNGIKSYVYAGTKKTIDNGSTVPENRCYCDEGLCPPSGVFDVSKCQKGAPIFLSYPHFYNADPSYAAAVRGMAPDKGKHRYFIKIEPSTGIQLEVSVKMQVNVYLRRNTGLSLFKNITNVFIPVMWLDTHVSLTDDITSGLRTMMTLLDVGPYIGYALAAAGLVTVAVLAAVHFADTTSLSCVKRKLRESKVGKPEESVIYMSGPDAGKEEVKYVIPHGKQ